MRGIFRLLWVWFDGVFGWIVLDGLFGWIAGRVGMRWLGTVLGIRQPENVIRRVAHGFNGWADGFQAGYIFRLPIGLDDCLTSNRPALPFPIFRLPLIMQRATHQAA